MECWILFLQKLKKLSLLFQLLALLPVVCGGRGGRELFQCSHCAGLTLAYSLSFLPQLSQYVSPILRGLLNVSLHPLEKLPLSVDLAGPQETDGDNDTDKHSECCPHCNPTCSTRHSLDPLV